MFDVVEFDGPGVGACATTTARHNSTAISILWGGDVVRVPKAHTCMYTYTYTCFARKSRMVDRLKEERRKKKEKRKRLTIDSYFIITQYFTYYY